MGLRSPSMHHEGMQPAAQPLQAQGIMGKQAPAAFMAATSSLVAKRPLMRGRTSAYALRLW